ncbi:MAG: hypothetical protein ACLQJR_05035 [Stellaceae bacterium]
MEWSAVRVLLLASLALGAGLPRTASAVRIPSCAQFIDFGARWVGIDEAVAAQVLGVPLYTLTDADIDLIAKSLQNCLDAAGTPEEKTLLKEDVKHMSSLKAARDRVHRALKDFATAKQKARPKLEQIVARLDGLPTTPRSRGAVDDAEATISAIFFELEQKRLRAQVEQPLAEDYPPYGAALGALARRRQAYAEQAQKQLVAQAQEALDRHHAELDRLDLPAEAQDATIILEDIDVGKSVRWLTLRQWAALVLDNAENSEVKPVRRDHAGEAWSFAIEVVRPGYGTAEFGFRQDGRDLLLAQSGVDGPPGAIDTPDKRREANNLLLAVAKSQ